MTIARIALPLAALAALAGCQSDVPFRRDPIAAAPRGDAVQGDWLGTDGVAISRFSGGGSFETLATDTGNKLAQGSYRFQDRGTIEIELTSLIRNTQSTVACAVASPSQLNCTSSGGQQFVLVRRRNA